MPGQGHDAFDLRVPVDVVSSATTRQEPSVLLEPAPDSSSGGVHACRYLHDRPAESQPVRSSRQDAVDSAADRIQAALVGKGGSRGRPTRHEAEPQSRKLFSFSTGGRDADGNRIRQQIPQEPDVWTAPPSDVVDPYRRIHEAHRVQAPRHPGTGYVAASFGAGPRRRRPGQRGERRTERRQMKVEYHTLGERSQG